MNDVNTCDKKDRVQLGACLISGPLRVAEYRVRDPKTDEWSSRQFHMTFHNLVMAVMDEEGATLFARFVSSVLDESKAPETPAK